MGARLQRLRLERLGPFTLTTSSAAPGPNTAPVVTADDQNLQIGDAITLDSMVGVSDADGDPITQYQFYDAGTGTDSGDLWTVNGGQRAAGQYFTIAAADLETVELRAGQAAGTDFMWVRAFDGVAWSDWDAFTLVTQEGANAAPVVTIDVQALPINGSAAVDSFISAVDADGDPIVQYQFYDAGAAATAATSRPMACSATRTPTSTSPPPILPASSCMAARCRAPS